MKTVVIAGGFGTRLQTILKGVPKPLAPAGGKPFLEHLLYGLKQHGLCDFIFCLHYLAEEIQVRFGDGSCLGVGITYSIENEPLGTGGAIGLLRHRLDGTFCAVNADTYLELDFVRFLSEHRRRGAAVTLALAEVTGEAGAARYGRVEIDAGGRVMGFVEKGGAVSSRGYVNAGLYLLEPKIFSYIPEGRPISLESEVFPDMIAAGEKVYGYTGVTHFFDIGTPEDYMCFQRWVEGGKREV